MGPLSQSCYYTLRTPPTSPRDTALELLPTGHSNAPGWAPHGASAPGQGGVGSFMLMTRWNGPWSLSLNGNWEDKFFTKNQQRKCFQ